MGFRDNIKGYRLYDPADRKIHVSRDVVLEEPINESVQLIGSELPSVGVKEEQSHSSSECSDDLSDDECDKPLSEHSDENINLRRSQRTPKPKLFDDYVTYACMEVFNIGTDPVTVNEALSRGDADLWKEAMSEEIQCFKDNDAWELIHTVPEGATIVPCKWVFKQKVVKIVRQNTARVWLPKVVCKRPV